MKQNSTMKTRIPKPTMPGAFRANDRAPTHDGPGAGRARGRSVLTSIARAGVNLGPRTGPVSLLCSGATGPALVDAALAITHSRVDDRVKQVRQEAPDHGGGADDQGYPHQQRIVM